MLIVIIKCYSTLTAISQFTVTVNAILCYPLISSCLLMTCYAHPFVASQVAAALPKQDGLCMQLGGARSGEGTGKNRKLGKNWQVAGRN